MSTFSDFDDFLRLQELKKQTSETIFRLNIKKNHEELQPFLKQILTSFDNFNSTIIQPRKPHFIILKKHEFIDPIDEKAFFIYRINALPKNLFANLFNPYTSTGAEYILPNAITPNDWYLKVALQFDILLKQIDSSTHTLTPSLSCRIWGRLPSRTIAPSYLEIHETEEWGKPFSTLSYQVPTPPESIWDQRLKEIFMIVTPAIFSHTKEVYGISE